MTPTQTSEAPQTSVAPSSSALGDIEQVADAQKRIIHSILLYLAAGVLSRGLGLLAFPLIVAAIVFGLIGVSRLVSGLGMSGGTKVVLMLLMFVPLANWLTLLILNSRATTALRAAGFKVGFLGVSR